jgi:hypothetical protein
MKTIAGLIVAGLMLAGTSSMLAQNAQTNGQRKGYGGPPQSEQERIARQAACLEKNGGVCPQGGPRTNCPSLGQGQGQGKGACDGTGPKGRGQGGRGGKK